MALSRACSWLSTSRALLGLNPSYLALLHGYGYSPCTRFGRKLPSFLFLLLSAVATMGSALTTSLILFCVCRLLVGLGNLAGSLGIAVLAGENVSGKYRTIVGTANRVAVSVGVAICALAAFGYRNFTYLLYTSTGLTIFAACITIIMPESPRWLYNTGRMKRAAVSLGLAFRINSVCKSKDEKQKQQEEFHKHSEMQPSQQSITRSSRITKVFETPNLRRTTVIMHCLWFSSYAMYVGLTLTLGNLFGDIFINVAASGCLDLPFTVIQHIVMMRYGRRLTLIIACFFAFVFCLISIPFEFFDSTWLAATAAVIISRAFCGVIYGTLAVNIIELFPSSVRQSIFSTSMAIPACFSIAMPYIGGGLRDHWRPLPNIIYSIILFPSCVLSLWIPETLHKDMPSTFQDAEKLSQDPRRGGIFGRALPATTIYQQTDDDNTVAQVRTENKIQEIKNCETPVNKQTMSCANEYENELTRTNEGTADEEKDTNHKISPINEISNTGNKNGQILPGKNDVFVIVTHL